MIQNKIIWTYVKGWTPIGNYYQDNDGKTIGYGASEIADWLNSDIQYSIKSVDIWLKNIDDVMKGTRTSGDFGIGNAHWVMIVKDKIFIGCEYVDDQAVLLTAQQLIPVLNAYREFLSEYKSGRYHNQNDIPPSIKVEYLSEGNEAITSYENLEGSYGMPY